MELSAELVWTFLVILAALVSTRVSLALLRRKKENSEHRVLLLGLCGCGKTYLWNRLCYPNSPCNSIPTTSIGVATLSTQFETSMAHVADLSAAKNVRVIDTPGLSENVFRELHDEIHRANTIVFVVEKTATTNINLVAYYINHILRMRNLTAHNLNFFICYNLGRGYNPADQTTKLFALEREMELIRRANLHPVPPIYARRPLWTSIKEKYLGIVNHTFYDLPLLLTEVNFKFANLKLRHFDAHELGNLREASDIIRNTTIIWQQMEMAS